MNRKRIIRRLAVFLLTVGILCVVFRSYREVRAVFDPGNAVHINASEIENSTLIIGSHLIHLSAVNDEIYKIAKESAQASSQSSIYYKSELGAGKWYDITNASSLGDIMEEGTPVSDDLINQLYMTHHTKSNGVTYDLRTNRSVCVYDIKELYDLKGLEELEPVWNHYKITDVKKSRSEIDDLYKKKLTTEQTELYDKQIKGLQNYYVALNQKGALPEWTEEVQKIMGKVDASRRIIILNLADSYLAEIEQKKEIDEGLLTAVGDSRKNVAESLLVHQGNSLAEGITVMSRKEYRLSLDLMGQADKEPMNQQICDGIVEKLVNLRHIMDGKLLTIPGELLMAEELLTEMDAVFLENLARGEISDITKDTRKAELEAFRNELQYYIQAKIDRMPVNEVRGYLEKCLVDSARYKQVIADDGMKENALSVVESYIQWLNEKLKQNAAGGEKSDIQKKAEEKAALEEKMKEAMDNNLIDDAKRYQAQAEAKGKEIKALEDDINKKLEELTKQKNQIEAVSGPGGGNDAGKVGVIEKEIAILKGQMSEEGGSKNIQEMKNKVLDILREGNTADKEKDNISIQVEGLGSVLEGGSAAAGEALKEIYKKMVSVSFLDDNPGLDDIIERVEDLIAENNVVFKGNKLTEESAVKTVLDVIGSNAGDAGSAEGGVPESINLDGISGDDLAAALAALTESAEETGNDLLDDLAANLARSIYESGREDLDLFPFYNGAGGKSIPVSAVAKYLKYRYIWSDSKKTAIISRGADYYSFTAFEKRYVHGGKDTQEMASAADFSGEVYIPAVFVESEFHCKLYPVAQSGYAIIMNEEIKEKAEEIKEALSEKGGG